MQNDITTTTASETVAAVDPSPVETVQPAKAKRQRKPGKAKAVKPAVPATSADRATAERERCAANRAIVQPLYNGPSLATHASRAPKLADALARVASPIQRAKSATVRDESALLLAYRHCDKAGTFCPVAATADIGALSRLASLGFLAVAGDRIKLTATGASRAKLLDKRAKA